MNTTRHPVTAAHLIVQDQVTNNLHLAKIIDGRLHALCNKRFNVYAAHDALRNWGWAGCAKCEAKVDLAATACTATSHCDTKHEHEITLTTDGFTAYAEGATTDASGAWRTLDNKIAVTCNQPTDSGPCDGQATFSLALAGRTAHGPRIRMLLDYGTRIDA